MRDKFIVIQKSKQLVRHVWKQNTIWLKFEIFIRRGTFEHN